MAHPGLFGAIPELERARGMLADGTPELKERGLFLRDETDLGRPEVGTAVKKLSAVRVRSSEGATLLVSEKSVPTKKLKGADHRNSDVYRLDPVLGPYPVELEFVYPFTQTVRSETLAPTVSPGDGVKTLKGMGYTRVRVEKAEGDGKRVRNRRSRRGPYPSPPSASTPPRSPRRP